METSYARILTGPVACLIESVTGGNRDSPSYVHQQQQQGGFAVGFGGTRALSAPSEGALQLPEDHKYDHCNSH